MTGCLYVSPKLIPALISDTIVSEMNDQDNFVLPSNIMCIDGKFKLSFTTLARKSYVIGERAAIAFSGNESSIIEFLSDISDLASLLDQQRPMAYLARKADDHGGKVQIIGAIPMFRNSEYGINSVIPPGGFVETVNLGRCSAIGSGSSELMDIARWYDQTLSRGSKINRTNVYEMIHGVTSAINGHRLLNEMMKVNHQFDSWGGYMEYLAFDINTHKWFRSPPVLNLFFQAKLCADGVLTTGMLGRAIAYDPGPELGRVLSVVTGDDSGASDLFEWRLKDLLKPEAQQMEDSRSFWKAWRPARAAVTIVTNEGGARTSVKSTEAHEFSDIIFELRDNHVAYGLSDPLCDRISDAACKSWGYEYRPFREIS